MESKQVIAAPPIPDLATWHVEPPRPCRVERDTEAFEIVLAAGRDVERLEQARLRTNSAAFWMFIGAVGLLAVEGLALGFGQLMGMWG